MSTAKAGTLVDDITEAFQKALRRTQNKAPVKIIQPSTGKTVEIGKTSQETQAKLRNLALISQLRQAQNAARKTTGTGSGTKLPTSNPAATKTTANGKHAPLAMLGTGIGLGSLAGMYASATGAISGLIPGNDPEDAGDPTAVITPGQPTGDQTSLEDMYKDAEQWASDLLGGASSIPGVGDVVTAADENGMSLPLLLVLVLGVGTVGYIAYKKLGKKSKTARKSKKSGGKK